MSNRSWREDKTYVKVNGRWIYLHRAANRRGPRCRLVFVIPKRTPNIPVPLQNVHDFKHIVRITE